MQFPVLLVLAIATELEPAGHLGPIQSSSAITPLVLPLLPLGVLEERLIVQHLDHGVAVKKKVHDDAMIAVIAVIVHLHDTAGLWLAQTLLQQPPPLPLAALLASS